MNNDPLSVEVDSKRLVRVVLVAWIAIEIGLVALDTIVNYGRMVPGISDISQFRKMANIAREDGIATWFSSTQMLLTAFALGLVTWRLYAEGGAKWRARGWALVCAFFAYMAFDDGAKIHERVATATKKLVAGHGHSTDGVFDFFPSYAWQLIFGPVFVGMGLFILIFFWRELRTNLLRLTIAAALGCYACAVGLDFVEGIPDGYLLVGDALGTGEEFASHYGRVLEEFLEMLGTTFFLTAFLAHFTQMCGPLNLRWTR